MLGQPVHLASSWTAFERSERILLPPDVIRTRVATRSVVIENKTGGVLRLGLTGPVDMTQEIAADSSVTLDVVPGQYSLTVQSTCGSETEPFDPAKTKSLTYSCNTTIVPR
jgi:hypothetical protein